MSSASISDLFEISPSGEELLCIDRFIGDENFIKLCQEFQLSSTTTTRKAFHLYSRITSLVLRGNCLSVRSAQTLSNLISNNQTLLMISLEWNQLGSESLIYLANALPKNTTLQCLDLRNNGITNDGANILAHSLLQNTSLVKLDLRWNQITDEIVGNFEEIYKKRSTTPFTLLLHGNLLSPKMMDLIDEWNSGTLRKDEVVVPPPPQTHDRNIELDIRIRELKKDNDQLNHQIKELLHQNNDLNRQIHVSALRNTELEQTQLRQMHWITQLEENLRQAKLRLINVNNEYEMATSLWQREREEMQEKYGQELSEYTNLLKISSEDCLSLKNSLQKSKDSYEQLSHQQERLILQHKQELTQLQEELKQSHIKCSEYQVLESQAQAKAQSAAASAERLKLKLNTLEEELELLKKQSLQALENERNRCNEEIGRMRNAFTEKLAEGHAREVSLSQELSNLETKVSDCHLKIASFELTLKQSCEDAAKESREIERCRGERIAENLKQRLEAAESFQKAAEERCSTLEMEAKEYQSKLTIQLNTAQSELQILREEISSLRSEKKMISDTLHSLESKSNKAEKEKELLQSKLSATQDKITSLTSQLQSSALENNKLKDQYALKEEELKQLQFKNAEEFRLLSARITEAVSRELTR